MPVRETKAAATAVIRGAEALYLRDGCFGQDVALSLMSQETLLAELYHQQRTIPLSQRLYHGQESWLLVILASLIISGAIFALCVALT